MRWLLAVVLVLAFVFVGCGGSPDRAVSRDSRFVAVRSHVSASVITFTVEDGYGHVIFAPTDRFTEPVVIAWDADERLWIRSAAGVVVWAPRDVGGDWASLSYADQAALTPPTEIARLAAGARP